MSFSLQPAGVAMITPTDQPRLPRRAQPVSPWQRLTALAVLLMLLAGCAGSGQRAGSNPRTVALANAVSIHAIGLVGTPYRYGGNTPAGGFDCSGLVGYVFREAAGMSLPRTTGDIASLKVRKTAQSELRVGDLLLFGKPRVSHIGIYVGEGRFVHAPSSGGTVRLDALQSRYWKGRFLGGRRLIE